MPGGTSPEPYASASAFARERAHIGGPPAAGGLNIALNTEPVGAPIQEVRLCTDSAGEDTRSDLAKRLEVMTSPAPSHSEIAFDDWVAIDTTRDLIVRAKVTLTRQAPTVTEV